MFDRYKAWNKKRWEKIFKEMQEYSLAHMIPIKVGDVISYNGGITSKNGIAYNGKGYKNGKTI